MKCPICNTAYSGLSAASYQYTECYCAGCDYTYFVQQDSKAITGDDYSSDFDYENDLSIATDHKALIQWNHKVAMKFLSQNLPESRLLDVGAYNGFLVKELFDVGYDAYGVDFNEKAVSFGNDVYGLGERLVTDASNLSFGQFDAVTAFEVIEHVVDPVGFYASLVEMVRPGGYLIISCPNKGMCWRPPLDNPPHHLSRFSPNALRRLMHKNDVEVIAHYEQFSVYDLVRNYAGARYRKESTNSLKGGEFRNKKAANTLKKLLNRSRYISTQILKPFDLLMYWFGYRYVSQVVIVQKR
jgi:2-polyprenyl-3-methyl-5-hydroxy-6-metoxy-1,4-benzoquinol methylase